MTKEESLLELLKALAPHLEKEGEDGFLKCPLCPALAWPGIGKEAKRV